MTTHHREGEGFVADLGAVRLLELIRDASLAVAGDLGAIGQAVRGAGLRSAGACFAGVGVSRVRATELVHEVLDDAVEVHAVVEAGVSQVDEVVCKIHNAKFTTPPVITYTRHVNSQQVMGSLSAYSSTSKLPMVVLTVANLDMFLFDRQRITEINAKQHPGRLTLQPVRPLDPVSTFDAQQSRRLPDPTSIHQTIK
jgi:hypothetical protein